MGRGTDNFFLILELDFLKPESDWQIIEQRIKDKKKFWNDNCNKGDKQKKYRQYKDQLMEIGRVMKTPELRKAEAKDAQEFVKEVLKEELKFFAGEKTIETAAAKVIMERAGIWPEMFEKMTGLKIGDGAGEEAKDVPDPNPKPDKSAKFKKYNSDLAVVNKKNLYDFLAGDSETDIIGIQSLDGEELITGYSNPIKEKVKYEKTEEATAVRTLCAACEEIFDPKSTELRKNYDKYIIWQKKDFVISRMVQFAGDSRKLSAEQKKLFTDEMTQIVRNREEAVKIIEQICSFKKIFSGAPVAQEQGKVACGHCYAMVDISHGEKKCSSCGHDLYIKCPKCQKEVLASLAACGYCGFVLKDVQTVETLCATVKSALENMEFERARSSLGKAEKLLPGYSKIAGLKKEFSQKEKEFSAEIEKLNNLVSKKAFYKAESVLRELQKKVPTAKIPNETLIETSVKEAERLYKTAVGVSSEDEIIRICTMIANSCADYPGVETLMMKYKPKPASDVRAVSDAKGGSISLVWTKSASAGEIFYKIVRKENTAAASCDDADAEEIGTAGICKFVDTAPKPGVMYYYSVYAVRGGVVSDAAHVSAVNLAEIKIIKTEEGDGFVRADWKPLDRNAKINVYRKAGAVPGRAGDGEKVSCTGTYFLDDTVRNDEKYGYHISVTYHISGKDITTEGISLELIPASLPEPAEEFRIASVEEGIFEGTWVCEGEDKVVLYCTAGRCPLNYGDVTTISKVSETLKPVDIVSSSKGKCRFRITDNKKYTIIPVTIKHSTAVIGEACIAASVEKIQVKKAEIINSRLLIDIKWPEEAVSVLVVYGENGYAKNIEDRKGQSVRNISRKQFQEDSGIFLKNIEQKDYYITLYSAYKVNGELVYSDGAQFLFSNKPKADIQYSIKVKGFFSKQVEIIFTSENKEFTLPEIDIVSKQGSVPVYATSGVVAEHIEEQQVSGSYKHTMPAGSFSKNSYIKVFFTDEKLYDSISLRPAYGTEFKVN